MHVHDLEAAAPLNGRFPRKCQVCMGEIEPGSMAVKISSVGPKGGKHFRHEGCALVNENPFRNAGRRLRGQLGGASVPNLYRGGKKSGQPRLAPLPKAASCDFSAMSSKELSETGSAEAIAELARRGRDSDGKKLAWKKAKNNPFGF